MVGNEGFFFSRRNGVMGSDGDGSSVGCFFDFFFFFSLVSLYFDSSLFFFFFFGA